MIEVIKLKNVYSPDLQAEIPVLAVNVNQILAFSYCEYENERELSRYVASITVYVGNTFFHAEWKDIEGYGKVLTILNNNCRYLV